MKRWTQVFKALANTKRLEIVVLLSDGRERHVTEIAATIHVTLQGASRHLRLLSNAYVLDENGKDGHVYYSVHPKMPADFKKAVGLFLH